MLHRCLPSFLLKSFLKCIKIYIPTLCTVDEDIFIRNRNSWISKYSFHHIKTEINSIVVFNDNKNGTNMEDVLWRLHACYIQFESQFRFPFELTYTYVNRIRHAYYYLLLYPFVNTDTDKKYFIGEYTHIAQKCCNLLECLYLYQEQVSNKSNQL